MSDDTLLDLNARFLNYQLLRTVFGDEPTAERLDTVLGDIAVTSLDMFAAPGDALSEAVSHIEAACAAYNDDKSAFLSQARSDYTRLFEGPGSLPAPPWSTSYLGDPTLLFQEGTLKIRNLYRKHGLIPRDYPHVADDHIALEFDFLDLLAKRMADSFQNEAAADGEACGERDGNDDKTCGADANGRETFAQARDASVEFIEKHLLKWMPDFAERLAQAQPTPLYTAYGSALVPFVEADLRFLKSLA